MKLPRLEAMKIIIFVLVSCGPAPEIMASLLTFIVFIRPQTMYILVPNTSTTLLKLSIVAIQCKPLNNHYMLQYAPCIAMMITNTCAKPLC